jgi:hypothetical protein
LTSIFALAGRRIDPGKALSPRFPEANVEGVRTALRRMFEKMAPALLIASAACGSDLLGLDAASSLGIRVRIVIPFAPEVFRRTSVVDRPPAAYWGALYDKLLAEAVKCDDLTILDRNPDDTGAYRDANQVIISETVIAAQNAEPPAQPTAVVVWEGGARGGGDATDHFLRLALERGFSVAQISTLDPLSRPR